MDNYNLYGERAKRNVKLADHMIYVTYPLVKDPKLLIAILENLFLGITNTLGYILYYERKFKRVPSFFDNFDSKYRVFMEKIMPCYNIDKSYSDLMIDIKTILIEHKRSPIEFRKDGKFIICSDSYEVRTLELQDLKNYLESVKKFNSKIEDVVKRNESIENNK